MYLGDHPEGRQGEHLESFAIARARRGDRLTKVLLGELASLEF